MIESGEQGHRIERLGVEGRHRGHPGVDGEEVVEPGGGEELVRGTEERGLLRGDRVDVVADDELGVDVGGGGEDLEDVGLGEVGETDDRGCVPLLVEGESLVDLPVEMDRELGDARDRRRAGEDDAAVGEAEAPGEGELPVEPRVEQRPAVDLDAELAHAFGDELITGLELERRRIGVGAEDPERGHRRGGRPVRGRVGFR